MVDRAILRKKRAYAEKLLKELISIPSSNPHISNRDELEIARFLREELSDAGLKVRLQKVTSEPYWKLPGRRNRTRYNVIARTRKGDGPKLVLNGHIDTVSGSTMSNPFKPRTVGDKLYGRGSADMKGGVAAIVAAAEAVHEDANSKINGELVLALVVDEETLGQGTQEFLKHESADFAVVAEPTQNTLGIAQAGFLDFNINSKGLSYHGQTTLPELWANAFVQTTNLCNTILDDRKIIRAKNLSGLKMQGTFNFTPTPYSSPPSYAWTTMAEFRVNCLLGIVPEKTLARSKEAARATLKDIRRLIGGRNKEGFKSQLELLDLKPGFIQKQSKYTRTFQDAMKRVLGHQRKSYVLSFCDATYFYEAGIPTVLFGPGKMELGHSVNEYTSIRQVKEATSVFAHAIEHIFE